MRLRLIGVIVVKLAQEVSYTRMGLRSMRSLRVVAIHTIDVFIRDCYLLYLDFLSRDICF